MNYPNQSDNPAGQTLTRAVDRAIANRSPVVVNVPVQYLSCQTCHKPAGNRQTKESGTCYDCKQTIIAAGHLREALKESERIHAENIARVTAPAYARAQSAVTRASRTIRKNVK